MIGQDSVVVPQLATAPGLPPGAVRHGLTYLDRAFGDASALLSDARVALQGLDFDTMVGVGLSGALVIPLLARAMGKMFAIVRKNGDDAHGARIEGYTGARWIFVDDLISTGSTRGHAKQWMDKRRPDAKLIGTYTYGAGDGTWDPSRWRPYQP